MENRKSIYIVLVETHRSRKDNKKTKGIYRSILDELTSSNMHVLDIEYSRLHPEYDIEFTASEVVDDIDDFFFNPHGLPSLENDEDAGLDEVELLIKKSTRMYSDNPEPEPSDDAYPDGNYIYVQILSDKKLYEHICEILTEYGFEGENIYVSTFVSSYSSFSNFQRELMKPKQQRNASHPPGDFSLN